MPSCKEMILGVFAPAPTLHFAPAVHTNGTLANARFLFGENLYIFDIITSHSPPASERGSYTWSVYLVGYQKQAIPPLSSCKILRQAEAKPTMSSPGSQVNAAFAELMDKLEQDVQQTMST